MKQPYSVFVEGVADKRFISQLITVLFGGNVADDSIIVTDGWKSLVTQAKENLYINQMNKTLDNGGVNLVVFDADDDVDSRRSELLSWKEEHGVDFELFLLPDNHNPGELEDLLESIINPENKPVLDCWNDYEKSLGKVSIPWRDGVPLTIPAKKTKIYAYLESLLGKSRKQKELIKENKRDYTNENHWNLKAEAIEQLSSFLTQNLK